MGETVGASAIPATSRPTLTIPPRPQFESLFSGGTLPGFSPGPMSLVSSFFADPCPSFSQLLAGAMASPLAKPSFLMENSSREDGSGDGFEMNLGYKQNRPMSLVVGQSPFFTVPSGLSPSGFLNSPGFLSPLQSPFGMSHQQALAHVTAQAALSQSYMQTQAENACSSQGTSAQVLEREMSAELEECSFQSQLDSLPPDKQIKKFELPEVSQSENRPSFSAVDKPACDGYNWRKYGQKMVKASECPRSYYKCTHLKCPVKKKVERSVDGHISEITYKGHHNHELPQPGKRKRDGCAPDVAECSKVKPELDPQGWTERNGLNGALPVHSEQVSTQMVSELPVKSGCDEIENTTTAINDRHDDELNAKRMKTAVETNIPAPSHKTVSESKIVVQTRSEVDLLDDGFKWRKYGQKVVKGNHHPRSYYRCTFPGCNVRKHVERASTDPKSVITTYEGRHDHDIPAAGNRNHNAAKDNTLQLKQQEMATWRQLKEEQITA